VTYVIAEPCVGEKNGACVDVCPAGCIHTTPDAPQNYIDPDVCIECEQCVLVCPVNAVFLDQELPGEWQAFVDVNADFFRRNKATQDLGLERAGHMVAAIEAYSQQQGISVAAVVLDRHGDILASLPADAQALTQAEQKAYTALSYGVATHELRPQSKPLWLKPSEIDVGRVLILGGGFPVVEHAATIGAVGVAGSGSTDRDILCCQAALGSLPESLPSHVSR
jgi:ferredoxin